MQEFCVQQTEFPCFYDFVVRTDYYMCFQKQQFGCGLLKSRSEVSPKIHRKTSLIESFLVRLQTQTNIKVTTHSSIYHLLLQILIYYNINYHDTKISYLVSLLLYSTDIATRYPSSSTSSHKAIFPLYTIISFQMLVPFSSS